MINSDKQRKNTEIILGWSYFTQNKHVAVIQEFLLN